MTLASIGIGRPIRPDGALAFGTTGCLARKGGVVHVVTCDHVINTLGAPEGGPVTLFPKFGSSPQSPIAEFRGLSLVTASSSVADLAAAPLALPEPPEPSLLPEPLPGTGMRHVTGLIPPHEGMEVSIWGARTEGYHRGSIFAAASEEVLPHPKYGARRFDLQMAIRIDPAFIPEVGDSGGPILTGTGRLVGFLAGGPQSCRIEAPDLCIAFGIPAAEALQRLGLAAIVKEDLHG